jgi:hypothetical protein
VTGEREPLLSDYTQRGSADGLCPIFFGLSIMPRFAFELFARKAEETARATPEVCAKAWRISAYCRSRISSIAALLPLSMLTTLWTGIKPVIVISTT